MNSVQSGRQKNGPTDYLARVEYTASSLSFTSSFAISEDFAWHMFGTCLLGRPPQFAFRPK